MLDYLPHSEKSIGICIICDGMMGMAAVRLSNNGSEARGN